MIRLHLTVHCPDGPDDNISLQRYLNSRHSQSPTVFAELEIVVGTCTHAPMFKVDDWESRK
jgi:hypothetical protein